MPAPPSSCRFLRFLLGPQELLLLPDACSCPQLVDGLAAREGDRRRQGRPPGARTGQWPAGVTRSWPQSWGTSQREKASRRQRPGPLQTRLALATLQKAGSPRLLWANVPHFHRHIDIILSIKHLYVLIPREVTVNAPPLMDRFCERHIKRPFFPGSPGWPRGLLEDPAHPAGPPLPPSEPWNVLASTLGLIHTPAPTSLLVLVANLEHWLWRISL